MHDIFRVRVYLHYLVTTIFVDNSGLLLNALEFFFKYHSLTIRFFYYDAVLMSGFYGFLGHYFNPYDRKRFYRTRLFLRR